MTKRLEKNADKGVKVEVDSTIYPMEAIRAAAYTLTDRLFVRISRNGKPSVMVALKPKLENADIDALSGEFFNELLHESLRLQVSRANQKIREYVVTRALLSAQVPVDPPPVVPAASGTVSQSQDSCPDCEVQPPEPAPPVDAELEKEIEKLLAEIEKGDVGSDPLGVAVPWEEKYGPGADKKEGSPVPAAAVERKMKDGEAS